MQRIGLWDEWTAGSERQLLNGIIGQTEAEIENVDQHVRAMAREIVQLRTIVTVLVNMLRDTNVVDPHVLEVRLQAAYDEALGPKGNGKVVCISCGKNVEAASTVITGDGPLCDACANR